MKNTKTKTRNANGNILIMTGVLMSLLGIGIILGLSFCGLFFMHNRLQTSAEEIALAGACKLNEFDRLGQMNNMVARSRQLVFASTKQSQMIDSMPSDPLMQKLAEQLSNEASDEASNLLAERQKLIALSSSEADTAMKQKYNEIAAGYSLVLPWLQVDTPKLATVAEGKISGVQSNVQELTGIDELDSDDRSKGLINTSENLNLCKEGQTYSLPNGNLVFRLSSLPAPVSNTITRARVTLVKNYVDEQPGYQPSATKVDLSLNFNTLIGAKSSHEFIASAVAAATGADVQQ